MRETLKLATGALLKILAVGIAVEMFAALALLVAGKISLDMFPGACTRVSTCFGNAFRIVRQKDSGALDLL